MVLLRDLTPCVFQVTSKLDDGGPGLVPFGLEAVSLGGKWLNSGLGLGQLVSPIHHLLPTGIEITGQLGYGSLKRVSFGSKLLRALTGSLEVSGNATPLSLNSTERSGVVAVQMLDLCAGGGEIGAQALNVSLGSLLLNGKLLT